MADAGHALVGSVRSLPSCSSKSDIGPIQLQKDCPISNSLDYDGVRLKWSSDLDSLKKFVKDQLGLHGKGLRQAVIQRGLRALILIWL